ncbi:MAG: hypothetical protein ACK5C8_03215, partial [Roseiflexaceae bacterium]
HDVGGVWWRFALTPAPVISGGHAAVPSFPQPTPVYSSLDEKMPPPLRGRGMTLEGSGGVLP